MKPDNLEHNHYLSRKKSDKNTGFDSKKVTGRRKYLRYGSHLLGIVLLIAAVYIIQKEFRGLSLTKINESLHNVSPIALCAAAGCTFLSYFILSFYDKLAVIQVGYRINFLKTAFAAFCSYVLSHNLGFSAISGAAVRFRLYSKWGLKPLDIVQVIGFCSVTYVLGAAVLIGTLFIVQPNNLPLIGDRFSPAIFILFGILAWLGVIAYVVVSFFYKELNFRGHRLTLPRPGMAIAQIIVSMAEVAATSAIAYCLIPPGHGLSFFVFLGIYIASYTAGLISNVPGGLGVFELGMSLTLEQYQISQSDIVSIILFFRLFYYIIPLFFAGAMFAGHEIFLRGDKALREKDSKNPNIRRKLPSRPSALLRESDAAFSVVVATTAISLCGVMVLLLPILDPSMWDNTDPFLAYIKMIGDGLLSLCGIMMLSLVFALSRRIKIAWVISLSLLVLCVILTVLRGFSIYIPVVLALVAFFIAPFSSCYYRSASITQRPFSLNTALEITLLLAIIYIVIWLSPQHGIDEGLVQVLFGVGVPTESKWIIFLSLLLGSAIIYQMMRPAKVKYFPWSETMNQLYQSLNNAQETLVHRIKPSGIFLCPNEGTALPFIKRYGLMIGLGDPAGKREGLINTLWLFRDLATQEGCSLAVTHISPQLLPFYQDMGLTSIPIPTEQDKYICCEPNNVVYILNLINSRSNKAD